MTDVLPTVQDINPNNDELFGSYAVEHFFGKTLEEAQVLILNNQFLYYDDLLFMGEKAFTFYAPAYCNYLMSCPPGESDGISCFASLLDLKLKYASSSLVPIKQQLDRCLTHCIQNFDRFKADPEIYGNLRERLKALQDVIAKLPIAP